METPRNSDNYDISIHALHEESDQRVAAVSAEVEISIHALHEESDRIPRGFVAAELFQSTLSMRRATPTFQSTHHYRTISIHALHEESD